MLELEDFCPSICTYCDLFEKHDLKRLSKFDLIRSSFRVESIPGQISYIHTPICTVRKALPLLKYMHFTFASLNFDDLAYLTLSSHLIQSRPLFLLPSTSASYTPLINFYPLICTLKMSEPLQNLPVHSFIIFF